MTDTAYDRIIGALRERGNHVIENGRGKAKAQCPAHDDTSPSLSVTAIEGRVLIHCHAGCEARDIAGALGLQMADLFDNRSGRDYRYPGGRKSHRRYRDDGTKRFWQTGDKTDRTLYGSQDIKPGTKIILAVEGEQDVDAARSIGIVAVSAPMGAGKADKADWSRCHGYPVMVIADKDTPGRDHAADIVRILDGHVPELGVFEAAQGCKDLADHIAAGYTIGELVPNATAGQRTNREKNSEKDSEKKTSQASILVRYVRDGAEYTLGITDAGEPYGTKCDAPHIALPLRGGRNGLRAELAQHYFDQYESAPSQQALADAGMVLEGYARRAAPRRADLRVAQCGDTLYVDMGDESSTVIHIHHGHWHLERAAPVLFRRTKLTGQLASPVRGGDLAELWRFIRVDEPDQALVLAWLVAVLVLVDVPHPILALLTEHGSAKSSVTRWLVDLVDPSSVPLRQPPRDIEGWSTAAAASWVVALDNLAGALPDWLSDCLCRACTGDGYVKRQLYSDSDVAVAAYRRCCIINGVDLTIDRGDLAERLLQVELRRPDKRVSERSLTEQWADARPNIFGGLLGLAGTVAAKLPDSGVDDLRMADFAAVLAAVDAELGTNGLDRYRARVQRATLDTLDGSFVTALINARYDCWAVPSKTILDVLTPTEKDWRKPRDWPATSRAVSAQLTRHGPALRVEGWYIDNDRGDNKQHRLLWTIHPPPQPETAPKQHSPNSPGSPTDENSRSMHPPGGELEARLDAGDNSPPTGDDSPVAVNSPTGERLTWEDELASLASYEYGPSLVVCRYCGDHIPETAPLARANGYCNKARCIAQQTQGRMA